MDYPNKTPTVAGSNLLASVVNQKGVNVVIDKAVLSDQLPNNNSSLANISLNDIPDASIHNIDVVKKQGNTDQPEITLHNQDFSDNYTINTIGVLAHASNSSNEILYAIATADNDPFIMPKKSPTKFDFAIALPIAFSPSENVKIQTTNIGTVSQDEFNNYIQQANAQNSNTSSMISEMNDKFSTGIASAANNSDISNMKDSISANSNAVSMANSNVTANSQSISSNSTAINQLSNSASSAADNVSSSANNNYQLNSSAINATNDKFGKKVVFASNCDVSDFQNGFGPLNELNPNGNGCQFDTTNADAIMVTFTVKPNFDNEQVNSVSYYSGNNNPITIDQNTYNAGDTAVINYKLSESQKGKNASIEINGSGHLDNFTITIWKNNQLYDLIQSNSQSIKSVQNNMKNENSFPTIALYAYTWFVHHYTDKPLSNSDLIGDIGESFCGIADDSDSINLDFIFSGYLNTHDSYLALIDEESHSILGILINYSKSKIFVLNSEIHSEDNGASMGNIPNEIHSIEDFKSAVNNMSV